MYAQDPQSVVIELRPCDSQSFLNSAIRHQSTTKYYPFGWRLAYIATILAGVGLVGLAFTAIVQPQAIRFLIWALLTRVAVDGLAVSLFSRRLDLGLSLTDFLVAEIILPFYVMVKPLAILARRFTWRGQLHGKGPEGAIREAHT